MPEHPLVCARRARVRDACTDADLGYKPRQRDSESTHSAFDPRAVYKPTGTRRQGLFQTPSRMRPQGWLITTPWERAQLTICPLALVTAATPSRRLNIQEDRGAIMLGKGLRAALHKEMLAWPPLEGPSSLTRSGLAFA